MISEYNERIALRISKEQRQKIEQLIIEKKFKGISQVVRKSLQNFLKRIEKEEVY